MITIKKDSTIIGTIGRLEESNNHKDLIAYDIVLFLPIIKKIFSNLPLIDLGNILFYINNSLIDDGAKKYKCLIISLNEIKDERPEKFIASEAVFFIKEYYVQSMCDECEDNETCSRCIFLCKQRNDLSLSDRILPPKPKRDNPFFALINKIRNIF
jgi:hypothetical protein